MATPLLQMQGISKRFPGVIALNNVSLEIYPGEIVALIGENGAGKSTLMKILGGVHQPDEGTISIEGQPLVIKSVNDSIGAGIGFIHQELNVLDNLDVASNVYLGREPLMGGPLKIVNSAKMRTDAQVYLDRLGLGISSRTALDKISIAQQQMVEIARTLSQSARLLIMDEPTSSLTLTETQRLLEVCHELKSQGVSIIYISHRLGEVIAIADRVVALRDGANAGTLARAEITHPNMVRLMVGRDLERFYQPARTGAVEQVLEVRDLRTQRYPNRSVSFDVRRGEILGLAGLVGAGRSEVAQAIFGIDPPLTGTVTLNGTPILIRNPQSAIKNGIYLIPEDRRKSGLVLDMVIRENVTLASLPSFTKAGLIQRGAESISATERCKALNVKTPSVEVNVGNLSGGNQQKVVLAKWIALNPKVIIFDEPTRGIDVGAKAEIYKLMRGLAESGVAVIMISSDMEEVLGESDRIAVMHEGAITGTLERAQASEEAIMELAVGGAQHNPAA